MEQKRKYDLEERLIDFAVLIIQITESLYNSRAGNHIAGQLVRSGTSPALHYGEAQSAESRADFIHKLKILLKELRESKNALRIIEKIPLTEKLENTGKAATECLSICFISNASFTGTKNSLLAGTCTVLSTIKCPR